MEIILSNHILHKQYKTVHALCSPLLKLRICGFIYMRRYPNGEFIDLSNQMEWTYFFLQKYLLQEYSPAVISEHMLSQKGIHVWAMDPNNIVWSEGRHLFDFGNGISICKQRESYHEIFCFYGKSSDFSLTKLMLQSIVLLEHFCEYFVNQMNAHIEHAHEKQDLLITPEIYMQPAVCNNFDVPETEFLQDIKQDKQRLTEREQQCIILAGHGKTAKEIGFQLNISQRTVEAHFANARDKLACKNVKELIAQVIYRGVYE